MAEMNEWRVAVGQSWQRTTLSGKPSGAPITVAQIDGPVVKFAKPADDGTTGAHLSLFHPDASYRLVEETA
jgi:hypothetical protein